jgi:MSHA pilin protein MshA
VIVILGILAVTAAPKFIDIQGDATASTLQGVKAALQGGSQLIYAKSAIAGRQKNANDDAAGTDIDEVEIGTVTVQTEFGYPDADNMTAAMVNGWVDVDFTNDWVFDTTIAADESFIITPTGKTAVAAGGDADSKCQVVYTNGTLTAAPSVITETDGC